MKHVEVEYSSYPPSKELLIRLCTLFESVYRSSEAFQMRAEWEFLHYPSGLQVRLFCAEVGEKLVGITVRHSVEIMYRGKVIRAFLASNTMVHPEYRGKGLVRALYTMAAENKELQLSKGTVPAMYAILKQIGYKDICPNTFQLIYLRPFRLIMQRLTGNGGLENLNEFISSEKDEMLPVHSIPEDFNSISSPDGIIKDADYLHWRYIQIPHKTYQIFVRRELNKPVSLLVLRSAGSMVYIVDIIWDKDRQDEPLASLAFAKKAALRMGAYKMRGWSTSSKIRNALGKLNFIDKGESLRFTFTCKDTAIDLEWNTMNFEHGDGDFDYL